MRAATCYLLDFFLDLDFFRFDFVLRDVGRPPPLPPPAAAGPAMPGSAGILPLLICLTIFAICLRASSRPFTCSTVVPLPRAMRRRREPSIACGIRRSCGVIE